MEKIISFIIPSYNVERYLRKALDSFLNMRVLHNMEVIIVDDGSKDHTAEIAQEYENQYPDVFRLVQKENGGHGSAINVGSKVATGKYFKVIDADDWVVTENLEEFVNRLSECDADVVLNPFHMVDMKTGARIIQKMYITDYNKKYTLDEIAGSWKAFDRCTSFHGITYRADFYKKYNNQLPEKVFYEDQEYATIPMCYAKKVVVMDLFIYQYLIGNVEQSVSNVNKIKRIGHLETVIFHMLKYWEVHNRDSDISEEYFFRKMEGIVLSYYVIMCIIINQKSNGRRACRKISEKISESCFPLYVLIRKKYMVYMLFSYLHINEHMYERLIHSIGFRIIRRNHKIEKETME